MTSKQRTKPTRSPRREVKDGGGGKVHKRAQPQRREVKQGDGGKTHKRVQAQ